MVGGREGEAGKGNNAISNYSSVLAMHTHFPFAATIFP